MPPDAAYKAENAGRMFVRRIQEAQVENTNMEDWAGTNNNASLNILERGLVG